MSEKRRISLNGKAQPSMLPRFQKAPPMSGCEYEAFYEEANRRWGVDAAAARAAERGVTLMVKSLETPYCVPYPEFVEEVKRRQETGAHIGQIVPLEGAATLQHAGEVVTEAMAEIEPIAVP